MPLAPVLDGKSTYLLAASVLHQPWKQLHRHFKQLLLQRLQTSSYPRNPPGLQCQIGTARITASSGKDSLDGLSRGQLLNQSNAYSFSLYQFCFFSELWLRKMCITFPFKLYLVCIFKIYKNIACIPILHLVMLIFDLITPGSISYAFFSLHAITHRCLPLYCFGVFIFNYNKLLVFLKIHCFLTLSVDFHVWWVFKIIIIFISQSIRSK